MPNLEINPDVLGRLRRFKELRARCTVVASSGLSVAGRIRSVDDPEAVPAPWQAFAVLDCRDGKIHRIPLSHIYGAEAIRPSGYT